MLTLKYFYICIILTIALVSCKSDRPCRFYDNYKTTTEFFQAFNDHDWELFASFYSDSAMLWDPAYGNETIKITRAEFIDKYSKMTEMSPDIKDSIVSINASENKVFVEFISSGSIPSESIKWTKQICSILTFKDGKIIKDATYYDKD